MYMVSLSYSVLTIFLCCVLSLSILITWKLYPFASLFTDQTTEATLSKFGVGVLYSIRMKIGIV